MRELARVNLIHKFKARLERLDKDKHSSLFVLFIGNKEQQLITSTTSVNVNFFLSSLTTRLNKLKGFFLGNTFQSGLRICG